jgi:hypothetical protein
MTFTKTIALSLFYIALMLPAAAGQSLKPEEIISKHLDAVGPKEKRDAVKTMMVVGLSEFESRIPAVKGGGRAIVVSDPGNLFFVMSLNSREYPFEKIGYFAGKPNLPFTTAGNRSLLGSFISEHVKILSDGLYTGVMSLRWPLLDIDKRKPKLSGGGTKKVNERKAYVIDYSPSGGGAKDFTIKLFFDAETFYHIRTEYRYEVTSSDAVMGQQNRRASAIVTLTEDFSDFKSVDGLMMPHYQRAELLTNGNTGMHQNIWGVKVSEYRVNQALQPDFFTFDPK